MIAKLLDGSTLCAIKHNQKIPSLGLDQLPHRALGVIAYPRPR